MKEEKGINAIVYLIFVLVIVRHAVSILGNAGVLCAGMYFPSALNILISIMMIVTLVQILCEKKWGVYLFVCLQLASAIINSIADGDALTHFFTAAVMIAVFRLIMCIRENGVSAWDVIMKSQGDAD